MHAILRNLGYLIGPVVALVLLALVAGISGVQGAPTLTTDKPDYLTGEVVHISGGGYAPGDYALPVLRPDGTIVKGDGSFTPGWDVVTADASGNLAYDYQLDGVAGIYEARVYPSDWSGDWSQALIASTTFADANANLDQCTNGKVGDTPEPCKGSTGSAIDGFKNWVNGNSNAQKSHWRESEFIPYRDTIVVDAAGTHVFQIHYDTVHGGKHAIDYLGDFDYTETTSTTPTTFHANNNNPCADKLPTANCDPSSPADSEPIPPASLVNCGGSAGTDSGIFQDLGCKLANHNRCELCGPECAIWYGPVQHQHCRYIYNEWQRHGSSRLGRAHRFRGGGRVGRGQLCKFHQRIALPHGPRQSDLQRGQPERCGCPGPGARR